VPIHTVPGSPEGPCESRSTIALIAPILARVAVQIAIHCPLLIAGQLANKSCSAPGTPESSRRRELCGSKSLDAEQRGFQRRCSSHLTRKGGGGGSGPTAVWQRGVRLGSRTGAQQLCCRATVGAPFHFPQQPAALCGWRGLGRTCPTAAESAVRPSEVAAPSQQQQRRGLRPGLRDAAGVQPQPHSAVQFSSV
jgi:hypothetical protein